MAAENSALHHRNKLHFKMYLENNFFIIDKCSLGEYERLLKHLTDPRLQHGRVYPDICYAFLIHRTLNYTHSNHNQEKQCITCLKGNCCLLCIANRKKNSRYSSFWVFFSFLLLFSGPYFCFQYFIPISITKLLTLYGSNWRLVN